MNDYFTNLNKFNSHEIVHELKKYAVEFDVPIISDEGLVYLLQLVRFKNIKNILEIGTAIGYSSINLALTSKDIHIDTIERNFSMYSKAIENIKNAQLDNQINVILSDALEVDLNQLKKSYDLIFIDAAKAQNIKFFEKYDILLDDNGIIVTDNLLFHGLVESSDEIESRNLRALIRKIKNYNDWLASNTKYNTVFLKIGDGMAVSEKNENNNRTKKS